MTQGSGCGIRLDVLSGKKAGLNRVIFLILVCSKKLLTKYDVVLEVKRVRAFRHIDAKTVYRRMDALEKQGWIRQKGTRPTKPGWSSELYEITLGGVAALKLDKINIDEFLLSASEEQLRKLIDALS